MAMTILPMSIDGLAEIAAALRAGEAVMIPLRVRCPTWSAERGRRP
jgi:hypothetical protein